MKTKSNKGASNLDGIMTIIILSVIIFAFVLPDDSYQNPLSADYSPRSSSDTNVRADLRPTSSYTEDVSLNSGNAPYAIQSYEEYITISNNKQEPINISGWQIRNAKDERIYVLGGNQQYLEADVAVIPRAALYVSPTGNHPYRDVVLLRGEKAIITTGKQGSATPFEITSFKENMCSGYLGNMPQYTFYPPLSRSCPRADAEPGFETQDKQCREFVGRFSSCGIPRFGGRDKEGENCPECIEGVLLSSSCRAFIKSHYNYQGCIAYHAGDEGFSGMTWRIFLGRGWEMWAEDNEIIKLYDQLGRLITHKEY